MAFLIFVERFLIKATRGNKMKKLITLVAAVGLAFSASAFAQTNQQGTTTNNAAISAISNPGLYVGAQGGVAIPSDSPLDTGLDIGAEVGYRFGNGFRVEEAFSYFRQNGDDFFFGDKVNYHLNTYSLMTNAYYDFNTGTKIVPYVGAGLGFVHNTLTTALLAEEATVSDNNFAIQGIAGVAYQYNKNIAFDVQYRHLYAHNAAVENNNVVEAGLNYYFAS